MQCDGNPHIPFDGQSFARDLIHELRRLAEKDAPLPYYPQPAWWKALRFADERDIRRFVCEFNGRNDYDYLTCQHSYSATGIFVRDGFNASCIHRTSSGGIRIVPEIFEFKTPKDRRGGWRKRIAEEPIDAAAAAATR